MNQDKQPEALRLAKLMREGDTFSHQDYINTADTLESQHARIAELESQLAAAQQGVQRIQANCYSGDDCDTWRATQAAKEENGITQEKQG